MVPQVEHKDGSDDVSDGITGRIYSPKRFGIINLRQFAQSGEHPIYLSFSEDRGMFPPLIHF